MGNKSEFHRAVRLVTDYVSFDKDITVQVFEATIRLSSVSFSVNGKTLCIICRAVFKCKLGKQSFLICTNQKNCEILHSNVSKTY